MSNKIYCEGCGQPTEYSLTKPKFCASCGGGFSTTVSKASSAPAARPAPAQPKRPILVARDDDDDDDEMTYEADIVVPRKLELEFEVDAADKLQRIPASSLAYGGIEPGSALTQMGRAAPKMTKKAVKAKYDELYQRLNSRSPMRGEGHTE